MKPTILFCLAAASLLACPPADALPGTWAALGRAASDTHSSLPSDVQGGQVQEALSAQAYLSALSLSGEALAAKWEAESWEAAQSTPEPVKSFLQSVLDRWHEVRALLEAATTRLGEATTPTVSAERADALVVAAHLLAEAENQHDRAGRILMGSAKAEYVQASWQRMVFLQLIGTAQANAKAAQSLLDALPEGGPQLDWELLQQGLAAAPTGPSWALPEQGIFHKLARHVEVVMQQKNVTLAQLDAEADGVEARLASSRPHNEAWTQTVVRDIRWWQARAATEQKNEGWGPLMDNLANLAAGSTYEANLLGAGLKERPASLVPWLAAGGALVAVLAGAAAWGKVRRRRRGALRGGLLGGLLLVLAAALLPVAGAEPLPADPVQTGVAFTQPDATGSWGGLALRPDGKTDFVWVACPAPGPGCMDVWTRSYDTATGSWSAPARLHDSANNVSLPLLRHTPSGDHLFWSEAMDGSDRADTLRWCKVGNGRCGQPQTLSALPAYALDVDVAPTGHPVITWTEQNDQTARILVRQAGPAGWGPPVIIQTAAAAQRYSDLAVDAGGTVHVAWQETSHGGPMNTALRQLSYATVSPAGTASQATAVKQVDVHTEPSIAILANGTVGILFNDFGGKTYLVEKHPGKPYWTSPYDVTGNRGRAGQSEVRLLADGQDWRAFWRTGSLREMKVWETERRQGMWLAPRVLLSDPFGYVILSPSIDAIGEDVHVAWTGTGPGAEDVKDIQMHYRLFDASSRQLDPPEVSWTNPAHKGWTTGPAVELVAGFAAQAPLDLEQSTLHVDGQAVPLRLTIRESEQVLAGSVGSLPDGPHVAHYVLVDVGGRQSSEALVFYVDSVKPSLEASLGVDGQSVPLASGWWGKKVAILASTTQDGGAPIKVQASADDGATYTDVPPAGLPLPENRAFLVRVRAIDEAGNVQVLPRVEVGWDATAPELTATAPAWSPSPLRLALQGKGLEPGSPVSLNIVARDAAGAEVAARTVPVDAGNATVELPDGALLLDIGARDAAGNQAPVASGLAVGIDSLAPVLAFDAATAALRVTDAGGLQKVSLSDEAGAVLREEAYAGEGEAVLDLAGAAPRLRVVALDRAGNEAGAWVSPATGEVRLDPDPAAAAFGQPGDDPGVATAEETAAGTTTSRGTPSLPALPAILLVAAVGLLLRRQKGFS